QLSSFELAARTAGTSLEAVGSGVKFLTNNMAAAATGSGEMADAFKKIGVEVKDAHGNLRAADDVLLDLAQKFADAPDGANKTAAALKLLGRSGLEMIPFLNQGKEGIRDLIDEAVQMGAVVSEQGAKTADAIGDNFARIQVAIIGVKNQFAEG